MVGGILFRTDVVGYCQAVAAFGAAACEYLAAVGCCHSFAEAMLVHSLAIVGLVSSFHCLILFYELMDVH